MRFILFGLRRFAPFDIFTTFRLPFISSHHQLLSFFIKKIDPTFVTTRYFSKKFKCAAKSFAADSVAKSPELHRIASRYTVLYCVALH